MKIYGVALLAACFLAGKYVGSLVGRAIDVKGDVGGVGFAMLFLMLANLYLKRKDAMTEETESGIRFWSAMYIPIIIAMAATQNVKAAFSGGWVAVVAAVGTTLLMFALIPMLSKLGRKSNPENLE